MRTKNNAQKSFAQRSLRPTESLYTQKASAHEPLHAARLSTEKDYTQQFSTHTHCRLVHPESFYTHRTLLHTANVYTETLLHTTNFHTQKLQHTGHFSTEKLLHTANSSTEKLLHREASKKLLHIQAFRNRCVYTRELLHREALH